MLVPLVYAPLLPLRKMLIYLAHDHSAVTNEHLLAFAPGIHMSTLY